MRPGSALVGAAVGLVLAVGLLAAMTVERGGERPVLIDPVGPVPAHPTGLGPEVDVAPATTLATTEPVPGPESADDSAGPSSTTTVLADVLATSGPGTFTYAAGADAPVGAAPPLEFSVGVEDGIGLDADQVAAFVDATLADPRGWTADGTSGFHRVAEGGTFRLVVASPATVDALCAPLQTNGIFSCARNGYVAINLVRWMTATDDWPTDLATYRHYLVNHEIGHYLRGPDHPGCPGPGELAPVMMQQTKGLDGCRPNGWPHP